MAVNRFDTPAHDEYFNNYVPLPYEQIMNTVAARQAQVEREQDMLNKTFEETKNLKYIPGSKDEQYVKNYLQQTANIIDKHFLSDLSDPIVKRQVYKEFNDITNRQNIQNIGESYAAWKQNQDYKAKLKAEGLYDFALDEDPALTGEWDTIGSGRVYDYITSPYKNPRPAAEAYFKDIQASDLGTFGSDYYWYGVDKNKIDSVVDAKWSEFSNTAEGNAYVRKIAKEQGRDPNDYDTRKEIAQEYLRGVGHGEFTWQRRGDLTLDAKARLTGKTDKPDTSYRTPYVPAPAESVLDGKKYNYRNLVNSKNDLEEEIGNLNESIELLKNMDPTDSRLPQLELEMQHSMDRLEIVNLNLDAPTIYWQEEYKNDYDKLEKELASQAHKHNTTPDKVKEKYKDFDFIETDVGSLAPIPMFIRRYYDKLNKLDNKVQDKIRDSINEGSGIKSFTDKRILTAPFSTDDEGNVYFLDSEGKKEYGNSSTFIKFMKENPQTVNIVQEDAATEEGKKKKSQEIEALRDNIRHASKFSLVSFASSRNLDGSFDVNFVTKFKDSKTSADVSDRNIKVRLTDDSQIKTMANDISRAGHPVEADIILNPDVANDIKRNKPRNIGDTYTVTPYPNWYSFQIKRVADGWDILDENGNKVKSGSVELPTYSSIDDVIHYMYNARYHIKAKLQAEQKNKTQ